MEGLQQELIKSRHNDIIKSPNDERNYRGLVLKNDMKVLLVSDPKTSKSAACMNIQVGSTSDHSDIQGLAHLCEHVLFLGCEKYPKDNDFSSFITQYGGRYNGVTKNENTNFNFDINVENFEEGLERFSQLFLGPLFNESNIEGEINNINSEYEKNSSNDYFRLLQIEKHGAKASHSHSFFTVGNIKSLKTIPEERNINVREELINFYKKWYSANIMTLSVLGKENLNDLERMVVKLFANVENKHVNVKKLFVLPFENNEFNAKFYVVPIRKYRNLSITFIIPDFRSLYALSQTDYITHLISNEGEGSLISALRAKHWSTYLFAGLSENNNGFNIYGIEISLTEEGVNHIDDIITIVFQYIDMLNTEEAKEWVFNEYAAIQNLNFRFMEKITPRNYVKKLSKNMVFYSMKEVLSGPYIFTNWNPEMIKYVLGFLKPELMRVIVVAEEYKNIANEIEPWYGTNYKREEITSDVIQKWKNAKFTETDFKMPDRNEFIPVEFDLKANDSENFQFPRIIHDTSFMRVWFKQDNEFRLPKGILNFYFTSPFTYVNPVNYNNCVIFVRLVEESLVKYSQSAHKAGAMWNISSDKYGINLYIESYTDKQMIILNKVMDEFINLKLINYKFEILKESVSIEFRFYGYVPSAPELLQHYFEHVFNIATYNYIEELKNMDTREPYIQAPNYLKNILNENVWDKNDLLNATDKMTIESLRDFLSQLFSNIHVECLIYGNFTEYDALKIADHVESKLTNLNTHHRGNVIALLPSQLIRDRIIHLEPGYHYLYEAENGVSKSSCTLIYYQCGLQFSKSKTILDLFVQIISDPFFTILRTKEQLGYIVRSTKERENGVQGLMFIVQSNKHPHYIEQRIDVFMNSIKEFIKYMPDEDFERHKQALDVKLREKPMSMRELSDVFWRSISSRMYDFDRKSLEPLFLATMTKIDVLNFYEDTMENTSENKKKLSIHVISNAQKKDESGENTDETLYDRRFEKLFKIKDIVSFKSNQYLYPSMSRTHP